MFPFPDLVAVGLTLWGILPSYSDRIATSNRGLRLFGMGRYVRTSPSLRMYNADLRR